MRLAALICAVLMVLSASCAEAAERVWRLGLLTLPGTAGSNAFASILLPYLATRGFVEGRNLIVDFRAGPEAQMPALAQALVGDKPDVIVASSDWPLHAAHAVTKTIPIVAAPMGTDPVVAGVAESWARPGGNVTGVSLIAPRLEVKRLALLHRAAGSRTERSNALNLLGFFRVWLGNLDSNQDKQSRSLFRTIVFIDIFVCKSHLCHE